MLVVVVVVIVWLVSQTKQVRRSNLEELELEIGA